MLLSKRGKTCSSCDNSLSNPKTCSGGSCREKKNYHQKRYTFKIIILYFYDYILKLNLNLLLQ